MSHFNRLVRRAIAHAFELAMHPGWERDAAALELRVHAHDDVLRLARARVGLELATRPGPIGHRAYATIDRALSPMGASVASPVTAAPAT